MIPPVAPRAVGVQPFLVMEILDRARALEAEGRSIMHLEVGEPDCDTPPSVVAAAVAAIGDGHTHYTHSQGAHALREAIARRYARLHGLPVDPERIIVTPGSSLGLLYLFASIIQPGDEVIVAEPYYPCYPNFVRFLGGRLVAIPTDPADGYRLDPGDVRGAVTSRTRAILVNSPSNPTGAVLPPETMTALAALNVPIVSDEIYHGLTYGPRCQTMLVFDPDACVVDGFSKRWAMTGWRLGWIVAPEPLVRPIQKLQQNLMISAGDFVQQAGIVAADEADREVEAMASRYRARRDLTVELFRDLGFGIAAVPEGAFYVFADVSRFTDDSLPFAWELLESAGVGVAPGIDFGPAGRRSVRLSYASSPEHIREAASRIRRHLRAR